MLLVLEKWVILTITKIDMFEINVLRIRYIYSLIYVYVRQFTRIHVLVVPPTGNMMIINDVF